MKVYIALQGEYDGDEIIGVYDSSAVATAELARARAEWQRSHPRHEVGPYWHVEEHEVLTSPIAAVVALALIAGALIGKVIIR